MSDKIDLGSRISDLDIGEPSLPVSKVILNVDSDTYYQSGDATGATIEADCPWATQAMADNVLAKTKGFVYKPYSGFDALLDPAAELGDTITVGGHCGVLAQLGRKLDKQALATVGAPGNDEIEDEYPYKTKQKKETDRVLAKSYSRISKTAAEIRLEVANGLEGAEAEISDIEIGLEAITSRVRDAEGNISFLEQTADSITAAVGDMKLQIKELEGLTVTDPESGTTRIKGGSIETDTLYVKSANITGDLVASALKGDEISIIDSKGTVYGKMSVTDSGALYIVSGVLSGFLLGGTDTNPVVTCLGTLYADNVVAGNIQTYLDALETRISRLEGLFG